MQVADHCQRTGKPLILNEMAPSCLDSRRRPLSGAAIPFPEIEHTRSFMKIEGFNESSKDLKRRLASNVA